VQDDSVFAFYYTKYRNVSWHSFILTAFVTTSFCVICGFIAQKPTRTKNVVLIVARRKKSVFTLYFVAGGCCPSQPLCSMPTAKNEGLFHDHPCNHVMDGWML
jgi:hypothetical protein